MNVFLMNGTLIAINSIIINLPIIYLMLVFLPDQVNGHQHSGHEYEVKFTMLRHKVEGSFAKLELF